MTSEPAAKCLFIPFSIRFSSPYANFIYNFIAAINTNLLYIVVGKF
jgi:hypothetical protein